MSAALEILFWLSAVGVFYIYIGYPLLIGVLARTKPLAADSSRPVPPFSLIIVGYNEAKNLPAKLESVLANSAADQLVDLHVASDGSSDDTAAVLAAIADPRVQYHAYTERRGKAAVLNELLPRCATDLVVLTDARQRLNAEGLERLLRRFEDPQVGVVSGELMLEPDERSTSAGQGMGAYWRYEKFIRQQEARYHSVPGATGALYALRRNLFQPIPPNSLLDDVAIPMRVVLQGARCVFESGAKAFDRPSDTAKQESVRKRRTIAGNVQVVQQCPAILNPAKNPIWWQYASHKLARLLSPALLVIALGTAGALRDRAGYEWALVLQLGFYGLAGLGGLLQVVGLRTKLLGIPLMFTSLNITTILAWMDIASGRYNVTWDRSDKPG